MSERYDPDTVPSPRRIDAVYGFLLAYGWHVMMGAIAIGAVILAVLL